MELNRDTVDPAVVKQPFLNQIVSILNAEVTADGDSTPVNFVKNVEWVYLVLTVTTIVPGDTNAIIVKESESSGGTYTTLYDFGTQSAAGVTVIRVKKTKKYLKVSSNVTLAGMPGVHMSVQVIR